MIAVCGAGLHDPVLATLAEDVGRRIAALGVVLVCGGSGGVMEAACRGAVAQGGLTLGLLPGDDRQAANPYVRLAVPTGMGQARNLVIVLSARVVIAIGGEYGTLSEIALARKAGRTVIGLHTWDLGLDHTGRPRIIPAHDAAHAIELARPWVEPERTSGPAG
jgi:hypothetical protein